MKRATVALTALFVIISLSSVAAEAPDLYGIGRQQAFPDVPAGEYESWPTNEGDRLTSLVTGKCRLICGMALAEAGPEEVHEEEGRTCVAACTVNHMPSDWPLRGRATEFANQHHEAAKRLGSPFPSPVFNP